MKVIEQSWGAEITRCLSDVLTPAAEPFEYNGAVEEASGVANKTAEAFGRLAELLVEKGVISLDDALQCAGVQHLHIRPATNTGD